MKSIFPVALVLLSITLLGCPIVDNGDNDPPPSGPGTNQPQIVTINEIRTGQVTVGTAVEIQTVVVTQSLSPSGRSFAVQDSSALTDGGLHIYIGNDHSQSLSLGDRITLEGTYEEYYGLSQLNLVSDGVVTVESNGTALSPQVVTTAYLSNSSNAELMEGMLVTVESVTVIDELSGSDEFEIDDSIIIDDYWYTYGGTISNGVTFSRITGVLLYLNNEYKIAPRSIADFTT
jgi:hypothetical protein